MDQTPQEPMAQQADGPVRELRYQISREDYLDFNFSLADEDFHKQRRRSTLMGMVELVIGVLFLVVLLAQGGTNNFALYLILDILLLLFGAYSVVFYKLIFPKQLNKAANKQYDKNEYLHNTIELDLYEDRLLERSGDYENMMGWDEIYGFKETENLLMVMLTQKRCILIPKGQVAGQEDWIRGFFAQKAEEFHLANKKVQKQGKK